MVLRNLNPLPRSGREGREQQTEQTLDDQEESREGLGLELSSEETAADDRDEKLHAVNIV